MAAICGSTNAGPPATIENRATAHSRLNTIAPGSCSGSAVVLRAFDISRAIGSPPSRRPPGPPPPPPEPPAGDRGEGPPADRDVQEAVVVLRLGAHHGDEGQHGGRSEEQEHRRAEELAEAHGDL